MSEIFYQGWAAVYEDFERDAARATWRQGIVDDLRRLGCGHSRILDLGAGTGIGRRVIADEFPGTVVVSLDQSRHMLEVGGVPAELALVGDMACFEVEPGSFDFVVSGFDVFNNLDRERLASCLDCVARALRPDGHLIFDYLPRQVIQHDWGNLETQREHDGRRLEVRHRFEPSSDRNRIAVQLVVDGRVTWAETHFYYAIDPYTIHELAGRSGLSVVQVRDLDRQTFSPASGTHVYLLHKGRRDGATQ
jgi:SAM-dependent methyltransferase